MATKNTEIMGYGAVMKWGGAVLPLLLLVVVLFFVYRYIKNINKRFSSIEEILGKVIEKNNQMQHLIQSSMRYPQVPVAMSSHQQSQSLPPQCPMVVHPPQPPVAVAPPPPNLDREIMEELLELDSPPPPPPSTSSTPVKKAEPKKKVVVEEEIVEGRVDEEVEVEVATTTTSE